MAAAFSSLTIGSYRGKEEEREKDRAEKGQEKKRDGCVRHVGDGESEAA